MVLPVAVIIPTYNRRSTLSRALDSVLAQSVQPQQICVVDDGSSDGTAEMIALDYPQVSYLYQKNRGVSAARNHGVANTTADWLAFLDSDDEWLPEKLERQFQVLSGLDDCRLIHSDEIWIRNGRRVNPMNKHRKSGGDIFGQCLQLCAISPSAVLMQRSLFQETGGFDESLPACEDYDLWLRVCSVWPVAYVDEALLKKYGGHADQLSRKYWGMDRFRVRALARLLASGVLDADEQRRKQTLMMLRKKCRILISGAKKRGNDAVISECLSVLERYGESDVSPA